MHIYNILLPETVLPQPQNIIYYNVLSRALLVFSIKLRDVCPIARTSPSFGSLLYLVPITKHYFLDFQTIGQVSRWYEV